LYGEDTNVFLLKFLIESTRVLQLKEQQNAKSELNTARDEQLVLLAEELVTSSQKPNFVSIITQVCTSMAFL
jgi:hypothetical protein